MKGKVLLIFVLLCACRSTFAKEFRLSVVNWNVQTFFDGTCDGCEYAEFKKSGAWSTDAYRVRLLRLCEAIRSMDADVFVLEEIENERILYDVTNNLSEAFWNSRRAWNYAFFTKNPGDAIGCAVLSRYPLEQPRLHTLDVRDGAKQPSLRTVTELTLRLPKERRMILVVNHWKSKAGGAEKSELWRDAQESLLARAFARNRAAGYAVLAAGDFNRDLSEFAVDTDGKTVTLRDRWRTGVGVQVLSPWCMAEAGAGSYFYKGSWERIDHFFMSGEMRLSGFAPVKDGPWCHQNDGTPYAYRIYSGRGYSDHLPIRCDLAFD